MKVEDGYITQEMVDANAWAKAYLVVTDEAQVMLIAQHYMKDGNDQKYPDMPWQTHLMLGFAMGKNSKQLQKALKTGVYDKGDSRNPCVLELCQLLRHGDIIEDLKSVAKQRELSAIQTFSYGMPIHNKICRTLVKAGFTEAKHNQLTIVTLEL